MLMDELVRSRFEYAQLCGDHLEEADSKRLDELFDLLMNAIGKVSAAKVCNNLSVYTEMSPKTHNINYFWHVAIVVLRSYRQSERHSNRQHISKS